VKTTTRIVALAAALTLALPLAAQAQSIRGTWDSKVWTREGKNGANGLDYVQLNLRIDDRWNTGFSMPVSDLSGLSLADARGDADDVSFTLPREAGTVTFEGRVRDGRGTGTFTFRPSAQYATRMAQLGFPGLDEKDQFTFAIHDVTTAYVTELRDLGYTSLNRDELVAFAIHGVKAEFIRDLNGLGYRDIPADTLVTLRIHGVTADYVRGIRSALGSR